MKKIPLYSKIIDELKERIRTGDFGCFKIYQTLVFVDL